jgi:hypothetical protein
MDSDQGGRKTCGSGSGSPVPDARNGFLKRLISNFVCLQVSADLSLIAAGGKAAVEEAKVRNATLKNKIFCKFILSIS